MARLEYNNSITTLIHDFDQLAGLPFEKAMLRAEADVVEPALRNAISSQKLVKTGTLLDSIGRVERKTAKYGFAIIIGPSGVHHRYISKSGVGELRSGHLGYILEHGAPRLNIRGRLWMTKAIQRSQSAAMDAAERTVNEYLDKLKL